MTAVLSALDVAILAAYFLAVLAIGFSCRKKNADSAEYFLGGRHIGWIAVGASLFATNISSEHFLGLAGTGSKSGLAVGSFEWLACVIVLLLGWFFTPFYLRSGVFTMPEFLERRFNATARYYLSGVSIAAYVLTKISISLYAGGILLNAVLGWDMYASAVAIVLVTGLYTVIGGLTAVMYTDLMQMFVLLVGSVSLTLIGLDKAGGWQGLTAAVPASYWDMIRPMSDPDFPWTGIFLGAPILGVWYWCTDQYIVQRVLSAKNLDHARGGAIFSGYLKILPVFLLVLPGVIAFALSGGQVTGDRAYAWLIATQLPSGLKGLVIAGLLAALMSSLSGMFNSASTLITMDVFKKLRPDASEKQTVLFGRIATLAVVALGLAWIPFIGLLSDERMYVYLQSVQAYVSPPIAACFLFGILSPRVNGRGALACLGTGLALGAGRFALEIAHRVNPFPDGVLRDIATFNFLHYAVFLFLVCTAVLFGVSLLSPAPDRAHLENLTVFTTKPAAEADRPRRNALNAALSLILVALLVVLYALFA